MYIGLGEVWVATLKHDLVRRHGKKREKEGNGKHIRRVYNHGTKTVVPFKIFETDGSMYLSPWEKLSENTLHKTFSRFVHLAFHKVGRMKRLN